jgi:uncharacterized membrane protein YfcA
LFVGALPGNGRVRQRRPPSNAAASFLRPTAGKQNGSIVSSLGIGSGDLTIPALDTALRLPIKVSSATSNFMIGVTAAASGVAYFARGDIDPAIAGPIALGSVIGSVLGARFLMAVSGEKLRLLFVVVIVALAAQMLQAAFQGHMTLHMT